MSELFGHVAVVAMGLSLGMLGGGGSILTVPILVYMFSLEPQIATSDSLFVVGLTAFVGGLNYLRSGEVNFRVGIQFAVPSFLGVMISRKLLLPNIPEHILSLGSFTVTKSLLIMTAFSILMLLASTSMIKPKKIAQSASSEVHPYKVIFRGLLVGMITGFVGAGGGFLIIPALVLLVGLSMRVAVGTSLFIIATNSLGGFTADVMKRGNVEWSLLSSISVISIGGLFLGMKMSKKIPEAKLKKIFGYFVLILGSVILVDQMRRM